jgi:GNAT superfamily N-acetyltransferase
MVRVATLSDIGQIQRLRLLLQANIPGINTNATYDTYEDLLLGLGRAWVYEEHKKIIAFGIVDVVHNNIEGLCVHPSHQKKGIGTQLLYTMLKWYFGVTKTSISLRALKNTGAHFFCNNINFCKKLKAQANTLLFEIDFVAFTNATTKP